MSTSDALVPFGFTALESEIYVFLLGESPATGYRVAQGIGKPAANTYKAIQTLQAKGAILVEAGASRLCRAVPLEELMARLQKDFEKRQKEAVKVLKNAGKSPEDERIYHLKSKDQILGRVQEMLSSAKHDVLLKMPMFAIRAIEGSIEETASREIRVSVLAPESLFIEGVEIAAAPETTPGAIAVVADGNQTLAGRIGQDSAPSEAVWTRYSVLAEAHHAGLSAEITLAAMASLLAADEKKSRIQRALETRAKLP